MCGGSGIRPRHQEVPGVGWQSCSTSPPNCVCPNLTMVIVNDWMFGATAFPDDGVAYVSLSDNLVKDRNPNTHQLLDPRYPPGPRPWRFTRIGHLAPFSLLDGTWATGLRPN